MNPIRIERDSPFISAWDDIGGVWATTATVAGADDIRVRSNAFVYQDYGSENVKGSIAIGADEVLGCYGLNFKTPVFDDDLILTLFSYSITAIIENPGIRPFAFASLGIATPTSAAGGDLSQNYHMISAGQSSSSAWSSLNAHGVIGLPRTDTVTAELPVIIGVGFMSGVADPSDGTYAEARINVRRLVGTGLRLIDNTKL